jgi:hypothetical protein
MNLKKIIGPIFLLMWTTQVWSVDFAHIPSALTQTQAHLTREARDTAVLSFLAKQEVIPFMQRNVGGFYKPILAKMLLGHDLSAVNLQILDPQVVPYAHYGTDISIAGGLCKRNGDYDFMMIGLIQMLYRDSNNALWPQTKHKIIHELITAKGQEHYEIFSLGLCGRHRDTENHILMTESTRYLINQLLHDENPLDPRWNNQAGGFDEWMLKHLQQYILNHFDEYNSRPYQVYTLIGLYNLAAYARNVKVKQAAHLVLDYLDVIWSFQNNHGRRVVPFRRQPQFLEVTKLAPGDGEMARMAYLTGHYPYLFSGNRPGQVEYGDHIMLFSLLSQYKIADATEKFIFDNSSHHYFQTMHHQNIEIYAANPAYLISAGGRWHNRFDMGTGENDGSPRPTTVILSQQPHSDINDFIKFNGHPKLSKRQNTCVLPDFACGLNLELPKWLEEIPKQCLVTKGNWRIYQLDQSCPVNYGVYLAIYHERIPRLWRWWFGKNFGLFEIRSSAEITFDQFTKHIEKNIQNYSFLDLSSYVTSKNEKISFKFTRTKNNFWEIINSNKSLYQDDFSSWPRAWGDILKSNDSGTFNVSFPGQQNISTLDFQDFNHPYRLWE